MRIDVINEERRAVVKPHGQLDARSARTMQDTLLRLVETNLDEVSLDLSAVPMVSSAGLAACSCGVQRILERSSLTIVGMRPRVRRLLGLAGVLRLIELKNTERPV